MNLSEIAVTLDPLYASPRVKQKGGYGLRLDGGTVSTRCYLLTTHFFISTQPLRQAKKFKTFVKFDAANIMYKYDK